MNFSLATSGFKELKNFFGNIPKEVAVSTRKSLIASAIYMEGQSKNYIGKTKNADTPIDKFQAEAFSMSADKSNFPVLSERSLRRGTGRLSNSITHMIEGDMATIGTNLVYGRIHEVGGVAGRGHRSLIPARPYLMPALLAGKKEIEKIFSEFFWKGVKKYEVKKR